MRSFILCALLATTALCAPWAELKEMYPNMKSELTAFRKFTEDFKRAYADEEYKTRFELFSQNLKDIERWNEEAKGETLFGITQFSDLTMEERKSYLMQKKPFFNETLKAQFGKRNFKANPAVLAATNFDWRNSGVVSAVKNQGACGCCWAFAVTAVAESMNAIAGKPLQSFSDQQVLDCVASGDCTGGYVDDAIMYIYQNGIALSSAYPYTQAKGTCRSNVAKTGTLSTVFYLDANENIILGNMPYGPIAVAFAVGPSFQHYISGTLKSTDCSPYPVGYHATMLTGYGVDANGVAYWTMKNQWGTTWGMAGYGNVQRNINWCEINSDAVTANG